MRYSRKVLLGVRIGLQNTLLMSQKTLNVFSLGYVSENGVLIDVKTLFKYVLAAD